MLLPYAAVAVITLAAVAPAAAQEKTQRADALFREGRRLMAAGQLPEACAKFEESNKVEASVGALLNLGECETKRDDPTAAWLAYRRAELLAKTLGDAERAQFASSLMREVGERLGFVTLEIAAPWRDAENLTLVIDGRTLLDPEIDRPIPVSPGTHQLRASADGARPLVRELVGAAGATQTVAVDFEPVAGKPAGAELIDKPAAPVDGAPAAGLGTRKLAGISMTAGGAAAIVVGVTLGVVARSQWNGVKDCRDRDAPPCTADEIARADSAELKADIATGFFVGGVVVAGAGLALWLTAPEERAETREHVALSPVVDADFVGLAASGSF